MPTFKEKIIEHKVELALVLLVLVIIAVSGYVYYQSRGENNSDNQKDNQIGKATQEDLYDDILFADFGKETGCDKSSITGISEYAINGSDLMYYIETVNSEKRCEEWNKIPISKILPFVKDVKTKQILEIANLSKNNGLGKYEIDYEVETIKNDFAEVDYPQITNFPNKVIVEKANEIIKNQAKVIGCNLSDDEIRDYIHQGWNIGHGEEYPVSELKMLDRKQLLNIFTFYHNNVNFVGGTVVNTSNNILSMVFNEKWEYSCLGNNPDNFVDSITINMNTGEEVVFENIFSPYNLPD